MGCPQIPGVFHATGRYNGSIDHPFIGTDISLGLFAAGAEIRAEEIIQEKLKLKQPRTTIDNFGLLALLEEAQLFSSTYGFSTDSKTKNPVLLKRIPHAFDKARPL